MKRTEQDAAFAKKFGKELFRAYRTRKASGTTDEEFAASIGVVRAQLKKYLVGKATPSVRTVWLAWRNHKVTVAYSDGDAKDLLRRRARESAEPFEQLELPFTLNTDGFSDVEVSLKAITATKYTLNLRVKRLA